MDFTSPRAVASLLGGTYSVRTRYFDARLNEVAKPDKPGRYGAIMEATTHDGRTLRRFRTLYRMAGPVHWWEKLPPAKVELDKNLGIDPAVAARFSKELSDYTSERFYRAGNEDPKVAVLLAGMSEVPAANASAPAVPSPYLMDSQWWVGLKRKLYGTDKTFPNPFVCPRPLAGPPAPVVREGTLEQAGMTVDGVAKIDQVCTEWAADSDQAFAVCVVRHGVIVLHKAYGQRDGKPMTVDTASGMASITKFICGATMLTVVDQGLVGLDDTLGKYLPPFAGVQVDRPLTVRHLLTHTSGLWGHWGDDQADLEEILAEHYPYLAVGQAYEYNGTGLNLGCKIMEAVSGEAMEGFYRNHLLAPLGCTNTSVSDGGGGARSIPLDMARIGQMMLNKGSYGDKLFFAPAATKQLLPKPLVSVLDLDPNVDMVYGLGCTWETDGGILPPDSFGHGAASSATLRIVPSLDLVIVMCRNNAGTNFSTYHPRFIRSVVQAIKHNEIAQRE